MLPGFIFRENIKIIGLITCNVENIEGETVILDSKINNKGLVTKLINKVLDKAKENNCKRVWLMTINDNSDTKRFYQKRCFESVEV